MSKLHVFIDGSWLYKACSPERALSNRLEYPERRFKLDFGKLQTALLNYARQHDAACSDFGERVFSTSIFSLPEDLDQWPLEQEHVSPDDVTFLRQTVAARETFTQSALAVGFTDVAVFRPRLKPWMIEKLRDRRFQEKQVDATVVALLVRAAIVYPEDYHAIITGDADILPAVRVAYPEYSKNVFVATTHPDQLSAEARQTAFSLADFKYTVAPYFLEQHAKEIYQSENVYQCVHCNKVFARERPIPRAHADRACCNPCNQLRT